MLGDSLKPYGQDDLLHRSSEALPELDDGAPPKNQVGTLGRHLTGDHIAVFRRRMVDLQAGTEMWKERSEILCRGAHPRSHIEGAHLL